MASKTRDIDALMADYSAAEQAGVFGNSAQPTLSQALTAGNDRVYIFGARPKIAIAATLLLAVGVWSIMFKTNLSDLRNQARMAQVAQTIDLQSALATCFGGPTSSLSLACERVDFDHDGDVDLGDYSTYQRDPVAVAQ